MFREKTPFNILVLHHFNGETDPEGYAGPLDSGPYAHSPYSAGTFDTDSVFGANALSNGTQTQVGVLQPEPPIKFQNNQAFIADCRIKFPLSLPQAGYRSVLIELETQQQFAPFSAGAGWRLLVDETGALNFEFEDYGVVTTLLVSASTLTAGVYYHVAVGRSDAGLISLYIDGIVDANTITDNAARVYAQVGALRFNSQTGGVGSGSLMDEARIIDGDEYDNHDFTLPVVPYDSPVKDHPFVREAKTNPSLIGVWTVPDGTVAGDIANDQTVFEDAARISAQDFIAQIAALGNWVFDDTDGPGSGLLSKCVNTQTNRGVSNYGILARELAYHHRSGMIIFKVETPQTAGQRVELMSPFGYASIPNAGQGGLGTGVVWRDADLAKYDGGYDQYDGGHEPPVSIAHYDHTEWLTFSWCGTNSENIGSVVDKVRWDISKVGFAMSSVNVGYLSTIPSTGFPSVGYQDFSAGFKFAGIADAGGTPHDDTSTGTVKWAAVILFSVDIGRTKMEALHNAIDDDSEF